MNNIKFTIKENIQLEEVKRRIHQFNHKDGVMVYLGWPSEIRSLIQKGILTPYGGREKKRVLNWYNLTEKGKQHFNLN